MNKLTTAWVKALRSGDYQQTTGKLKGLRDGDFPPNTPPGYCCLGVLCDISTEGKWEGFSYVNVRWDDIAEEWDADIDFEVFEQWTGLSEEAKNALIHFNDEDKFDFNQIADAIERYAKGERPPSASMLTEGNY